MMRSNLSAGRWMWGMLLLGAWPGYGEPTGQPAQPPAQAASQEPAPKEEAPSNSSDAKEKIKASPAIVQFFRKEVGRGVGDVIEISELQGILDSFERDQKVLIPDREVIESQSMTSKELMETLDRALTKDPKKIKKVTSTGTRIEGGKSLANLKPFQRRDVLNNPDKLLELPAGSPPVRSKDVIARAILRVRPDLADGKRGPQLSRYMRSGARVSDADYTKIVREFMVRPTGEQFELLDLAIQRAQNTPTKGDYSNGRPRRDGRGNEVFPNGARKYDDQGRPLYANGKPQFDEQGNALHSNGRPKYGADGTSLPASRPSTSSTTSK